LITERICRWISTFLPINRFNEKGSGHGVELDKQDHRDYIASASSTALQRPKVIDLRNYIKEIKSQGRINSCVAHTICSSIEMQLQMKKQFIPLSEKYVYYFGRKASKLFPQDSGMYTRDAIKSCFKKGIAPEFLWQYYKEDINKEPSHLSQVVAHIYGQRLYEYRRLLDKNTMQDFLAKKIPIIMTVPFYSYWADLKSDTTLPVIRGHTRRDNFRGYHSVLVVGYNTNGWIIFNSWGPTWGYYGCALLPYDYKTEDKWVILMEGK
jgi:C1A family cysteine protease